MENVPYLTEPRLHDRVVQNIREYFDNNIDWLEYSYPIAIIGHTTSEEGEEHTYPMVYKGDGSGEHYDIRPDWDVGAYCFFELREPVEMVDEEEGTRYPLSLIFYARLDKCYPGKAYDYTAELMAEVIMHLKEVYIDARVMTYDINPETIFSRYSEMEQLATQWAMKHGTAFKIDFTIHDMQDCYSEVS